MNQLQHINDRLKAACIPVCDSRSFPSEPQRQSQLVQTLQHRIDRLGYQVHLTPIATAQPPS